MSRIVVGLKWAKPCGRPPNIPKSRPRGRKAAGLRYERELAKAIPRAEHGQWFEFEDSRGLGWCQPDLLLPTSYGVAILESKYTWVEEGHSQVGSLYVPVVEAALGRRAFGLVVCKVLTQDLDNSWVCRDLESAILRAAAGRRTVLHWIGTGLGPLKLSPPASHLAQAARAG